MEPSTKNTLQITASGKLVDPTEYFTVNSVKWETEQSQWGNSFHTLVIRYDKNILLKVLTIEKIAGGEHINSVWINTDQFRGIPFYDWQKKRHSQTKIRAKIVELLKDANLNTLQKNEVNSSSLKYLFLK